MAIVFQKKATNLTANHLTIYEEFPNCVSVTYTPSQDLLDKSNLNDEEKKLALSKEHQLIFICGQDNFVSIYPINTLPTHNDFLKNKYSKIESITLQDFDYITPETIDEVLTFLNELPAGFIKNHEYGLGLLNEYRFIISSIEELPTIRHLVIKKDDKEVSIENEMYTLSFNDFEALRKGMNRITSENQSKSRKEKSIFSYNLLLSQLNPSFYPEKKKTYKNGMVYEFLDSTSFESKPLSKKDSEAVINMVIENKNTVYKNSKKEIIKLQQDIEILNLKYLVEETRRLLDKKSSESEWQNFFNENPFILFLVFGYPVVKIQDQASVGGRKLSGAGDKITDFLIKNNLSNNCALIEIKKPSTPLLNSKEYRGGVFSPSSELSGSINQILDQKYKFQKEISLIKDNSGVYDMESYAVDCVLIIGTMPLEKEKKKSFEMFRYNSKDVRIYTFDELVHKLKDMYLLLKGDKK